MPPPVPHKNYIQRLYKRALRTAFDHYGWEHDIYRQHCLQLRERFEAERHERNPVRIEALVRAAEEELNTTAHYRPFKFPAEIGGTKYGRNHVPSRHLCEQGAGDWVDDIVEYEKI